MIASCRVDIVIKSLLYRFLVSVILFLFFSGCRPETSIILPGVFSDNMVLQQKANVNFWGKTLPGKSIVLTTTWSEKIYSVKADKNGNWKIEIVTPSYGGPYSIDISDGTNVTLKNIMIGEVWLCSGQSNMEMPLGGWGMINDFQKEIYIADYPNIRLLTVKQMTANQPQEDLVLSNKGWQKCSPETVEYFSSVAYFFAKEIYKKTGVPIGLIQSSWGGTIVEAWTSGKTLKNIGDFAKEIKKIEEINPRNSASIYKKEMKVWEEKLLTKDSGYQNSWPTWAEVNHDISSWKDIWVPGFWEKDGLSDFNGVVWLRRTINIPELMAGKDLKLNLGNIDDNDITFFDGKKIGETYGYDKPRIYFVPGSKIKAGLHVLTVRVLILVEMEVFILKAMRCQ